MHECAHTLYCNKIHLAKEARNIGEQNGYELWFLGWGKVEQVSNFALKYCGFFIMHCNFFRTEIFPLQNFKTFTSFYFSIGIFCLMEYFGLSQACLKWNLWGLKLNTSVLHGLTVACLWCPMGLSIRCIAFPFSSLGRVQLGTVYCHPSNCCMYRGGGTWQGRRGRQLLDQFPHAAASSWKTQVPVEPSRDMSLLEFPPTMFSSLADSLYFILASCVE